MPIPVPAAAPVAAPASSSSATTQSPPSAAPSQASAGGDDPYVLHAESSLAEADGDLDRAVALLERANSLLPGDPLVSGDLDRLLERVGRGGEAELARLRRLAETDPRARVQLAQRYLNEAQKQIDSALRDRPADAQAVAIDKLLKPGAAPEANHAVGGRVRFSTGVDTNVAVVPDGASGELGIRAALDGSVDVQKRLGALRLEGQAGAALGMYLNQRGATGTTGGISSGAPSEPAPQASATDVDLSRYDFASIGASAGLVYQGAALARLRLSGSEVFIADFRHHFMQDLGLYGELGLPLGGVSVGAYGQLAYRDFVHQNAETAKRARATSDRDGARFGGGLWLRGAGALFWGSLQAGYLEEFTQGRDQKQRGVAANGAIGVRPGKASIAVAMLYEYRDYWQSSEARLDQRFGPALSLSYAVSDAVSVFGAYRFFRNASSLFPYSRHVAQVGVEGRW